MLKITPFLWFDGNAEEAVNFYASIFPEGKVKKISRVPEGAHAPAGSVMVVEFELLGQRFYALNGGPHFKFSEAISFMIECETQDEVDYYWDRLLEGGGETMACGWLKDKYGLAWQVTPKFLMDMYTEGTPEQATRVMQAMMQMVKLDGPALQRAFHGE